MWPFKFQIWMILTMAKYHENSLRESPLSFLSPLETQMILKIPKKNHTRYIQKVFYIDFLRFRWPFYSLFAHRTTKPFHTIRLLIRFEKNSKSIKIIAPISFLNVLIGFVCLVLLPLKSFFCLLVLFQNKK